MAIKVLGVLLVADGFTGSGMIGLVGSVLWDLLIWLLFCLLSGACCAGNSTPAGGTAAGCIAAECTDEECTECLYITHKMPTAAEQEPQSHGCQPPAAARTDALQAVCWCQPSAWWLTPGWVISC